jgi:hypothetical protein
MRRPVLSIFAALSLTSLTVIIGACASSPDTNDELTELKTEKEPTESGESSKLPPPSQTPSTSAPEDAGATAKDSGKDASPPPKDASTPPADANTGTGTGAGGDCDPNDPMYMIAFALMMSSSSSPTPCPCSASQCCYLSMACLPK